MFRKIKIIFKIVEIINREINVVVNEESKQKQ